MMTKAELQARARERVLSEGVKVWRLDERRFAVPSSTVAGQAYELAIHEKGDIACNCPGALYRGVCKHQQAVEMVLEHSHSQG